MANNYNKKRDRGKSLGSHSQLAHEHPTEINKDISFPTADPTQNKTV